MNANHFFVFKLSAVCGRGAKMEIAFIVSGIVLTLISVLFFIFAYYHPNTELWGKSVTTRNMTTLVSFWILVILWAVWAMVLFSFLE